MNDVKFVPHPDLPWFKDRTGIRYNRLVALGYVGKSKWLCRCDCGNETIVIGGKLTTGHTQSCGCYKMQRISETKTRHGRQGTPEYKSWSAMRQRCLNKNDHAYDLYGGRGIKVCQGWADDFGQFYEDLGSRPTRRHSLDRIDCNGNYSCGHCAECIDNKWTPNCRWATPKQQNQNRRNVKMITFRGKTMSVTDWAEIIKVDYRLIHSRLKKGWSIEKTLTTPAKENKRYLEFDGKCHYVKEWADITGITEDAIRKRLRLGWPVEKILTAPVKK